MQLANDILLVLHLIGVGALLSGFFYQLKDWGKGMKINAGIFHGAWLMVITGMGMVGLIQAIHGDMQVNNIVMAVKTVIVTVIFFIAYGFKKNDPTPKWVVPSIAGLTTLNIILAVFGPILIPA